MKGSALQKAVRWLPYRAQGLRYVDSYIKRFVWLVSYFYMQSYEKNRTHDISSIKKILICRIIIEKVRFIQHLERIDDLYPLDNAPAKRTQRGCAK